MSGSMRYEGRKLCEHYAARRAEKNRSSPDALPTAMHAFSRSNPGQPERHLDAGATGAGFANGDHAIMPPDNFLNEIETKSGAPVASVQPVERFKHALAMRRRNAGAVIPDRNPGRTIHPYRDQSLSAAILNRVLNQDR